MRDCIIRNIEETNYFIHLKKYNVFYIIKNFFKFLAVLEIKIDP